MLRIIFFLHILLISFNIAASDTNPFMSNFKEIYNNKPIEYPILNHRQIINRGNINFEKVTGKGVKILLIDGNNEHAFSAVSLINDPVCGIASGAEVILKQHIFYKGYIDESLPFIIRESFSQGIDFISISFKDMLGEFYPTWQEVFLEAKDKGIGILMSAGNDAGCLDTIYPDIGSFLKKMDKSFLFVMASTYENNTEELAGFSNYPKDSGESSNFCITAPGERLLSKNHLNEYQYFGGTSAATPVTAGVAALIKEANPSLSSQQVLDVLFKSARMQRHPIDTNKEPHSKIKILNVK